VLRLYPCLSATCSSEQEFTALDAQVPLTANAAFVGTGRTYTQSGVSEFHQPGRVSSWALGPAGGQARFHVVDLDIYGCQDRSPTPDPDDDLNPPP
jgi:hypothetical protein